MDHTQPLEKILGCFPDAKQRGKEWIARCSAHEPDEHPSLSIREGEDGTVLLKCRSQNCSADAIVKGVGLELRDLFPPKSGPNGTAHRRPVAKNATKPTKVYPNIEAAIEGAAWQTKGEHVKSYIYSDTFHVLRFNLSTSDANGKPDKQFRPLHRTDAGWLIADPPGLLPLYRLDTLADADEVWGFEGEGCVDEASKLGVVCTTSAHGSLSAHKTDWRPLSDKTVILFPDNDDSGRTYMRTVATIATTQPNPARVKIVELPGLPEHGDIVDWIAERDSRDTEDIIAEIRALIDAAPWFEVEAESSEPTDNRVQVLTEFGDAESLARRHGENMRYTLAAHWRTNVGTHWRMDSQFQVQRWAKKVVRSWYADAAKIEDDEARKKLVTYARAAEKRDRILKMVDLARYEPGITVDEEDFDKDPFALNFKNGTVDLRTGALRPHSRDDLITKLIPHNYNPDARCETWKRALLEMMNDRPHLVGYLQRQTGYSATGSQQEQDLRILNGPGGNGKTLFAEMLQRAYGPYGTTIESGLLRHKERNEHTTGQTDLFGVRLALSMEFGQDVRLDETLIKRLTGGDRMKARRMRCDNFEWDPTHHLWLGCNHKPVIRGTDHAMWRRVKLIPFDVTFRKPAEAGPGDRIADLRLRDKLLAEIEGILAWIVAGAVDWYANGMQEPSEVSLATQTYRAESDALGEFLEERCTTYRGATASAGDLHAAYMDWAKRRGEHAITQTEFGREMTQRGFARDRNKITRRKEYAGIGLLESETVRNG